ncbi:MAG: endonuclease/exonuclease/phosphatase family protein [Bacteroidetes bacterium]|nr:endonuclease/exonuclease/phosphatase family protein [Bacteroidota bacterium]
MYCLNHLIGSTTCEPNRIVKAFLILTLVLSMAGWTPAQVPLKVMTFNIRYNNPADSIYNWAHRKDMVIGVFQKYSPDIAGLQEALFSQLTDLKDSLKNYSWFGAGRDDGQQAGEFAPIFYKTSRFIKVDGAWFWLSKSPEIPGSRSWHAACTRIVTWMMLRDRQSGQLFFIFNTHFDHASEEARLESSRLLRKEIDEITSGRSVIVCGDFNSTASDQAYKLLTDKSAPGFLIDTRASLPDSVKEPTYSFIGFPFHPEEQNLIDFIFTRNAPLWKVGTYHIITDNRDGLYPSDHLPVMTEFMVGRLK